MTLSIYYDGDCPFCARYVALLRLKETVGPVTIINLRDSAAQRQELLNQGFDLDNGMVVEMGGKRFGGADAVNRLAVLSTSNDGFNRLNKWALSSPLRSKIIYPFLRAGRWLILFIMGRSPIMPEREGALARAAIFGAFFAMFSVFHFFNYILEYQRIPPQLDQVAILICAVLLFFKPRSPRLLCLLMVASTISAIAQAPIQSNHTIVRNFAILGYWMSFFYVMLRGRRWSDIFTNFTVAGQGTLLVMYFFGVFHKINSDFLNPETSCAVTLWQKMPPPLNLIDGPIMHYLAIYGTFVVEGVIILLLLFARTRHFGVVAAILFHLLLAFSGYAMYISFTTLAISLHCLFLNEESALRIQNSALMQETIASIAKPTFALGAILLVGFLIFAGVFRIYSLVTFSMLPVILPFCLIIILNGRSTKPMLTSGYRKGAWAIGAVVTSLFFANCALPYFGLKTAQSVNMFANLRLEGGISNHLILQEPPGPFKYLEDVVKIERADGGARIALYADEEHGMVYYDLLAYFADNPDAVIDYTRGGMAYRNITADTLSDEIAEVLHPAWVRKWFHFQAVNLKQPENCRY